MPSSDGQQAFRVKPWGGGDFRAVPPPSAAPPKRAAAPGDATNWLERCPSSQKATAFWLNFMFTCARRLSWFMDHSEWLWMAGSKVAFRAALRSGPRANGKWLLGPGATPAQLTRFEDRVLRHFYRFIYDVGRAGGMDHQAILNQIDSVEGRHHYEAARAHKRGAIFATAHLGSFEVGIAALADLEPRVHVVFQQDVFGAFDAIRDQLHRKVGVIDAPVGRGPETWMALRDVLQRDEVVLIQADRVMPGQKGLAVPFMGGHIELPMGPVKLAALSGAPILPVFTIRLPNGKAKIVVEPAIEVRPDDRVVGVTEPPRPLLELAAAIEKHVRAYPEQWLMLHPMWCEDRDQNR